MTLTFGDLFAGSRLMRLLDEEGLKKLSALSDQRSAVSYSFLLTADR